MGSKTEQGKGDTHKYGRWLFGVSESKWGEEGIRVSQPSGVRGACQPPLLELGWEEKGICTKGRKWCPWAVTGWEPDYIQSTYHTSTRLR